MSSQPEKPYLDAFTTCDKIAQFWEAAFERLKISVERTALMGSVKVKMAPVRVIWHSDEHDS